MTTKTFLINVRLLTEFCFSDGDDNEAADGEPEESTRGKKRKHEDDDEN